VACAEGEFCAGGAADVVACAAGQVDADNSPATACVACAEGEFCAGGAADAVACAAGQVDGDNNPATACVACVAGQFCAGGAADAVSCASNQIDADNNPATPCVDTFAVGGTVSAPSFAQVVITNRTGSDVVNVVANATTFAFSRRFLPGESYDVVAAGQAVTCAVTNGTGTVTAEVTNIAVVCTLAPLDIALTNPSTFPDVLPADVDLEGVEFDVRLSAPFAAFYGTPAGVEVRTANGALAARGTWALRNGSTQDARITFVGVTPAIGLGPPRAEPVRGLALEFASDDDCPAGQVPIGLDAQVGAAINGLSVVCGTLQVDPGTLAVTLGAGATLPLRGGDPQQNTNSTARCPTDTLLVAFTGTAGSDIERVELECAALSVTGTAPTLAVTIGAPVAGVAGSALSGSSPTEPFQRTTCAAGEVARGLTVGSELSIRGLGLRCSAVDVGFPASLAAVDHQLALSSTFSLNAEAPADRIFATAAQPLRVLPRGLTAVTPPTIFEGDPTPLLGQGIAVFGDAIVAFRRDEQGAPIPEALFRALLEPQSCTGGRTQAGCILQQAPFTMESEFPGVYEVCVVPDVDPNNLSSLPDACPAPSPTLTILVQPAGAPDASFQSTPLVRQSGATESAGVVGFDAEANLYVAGISAGEAVVAKLFPDGSPDSNYGTAGFALAGLTTAAAAPGCLDVAADGTVTIATALTGTDGNSNPAEVHVVRFLPDGDIDVTYGSAAGTFINDSNTFAEQYAVQGCKRMSDDRLVIGASFFSTGASTRLQSMWRIAATGAFSNDFNVLNDPSFTNEDGVALVSGPGDTAVIVGRLDAAAGFLRIDNSPGMFVGTWTPVTLDASPTAVSAFTDAVVLGDGSFVAVGTSVDSGNETPRAVVVDAQDVAGTPVAFNAGSGALGPYRIAPEPTGRFVVASASSPPVGPTLVRLEPGLTNDVTWGTGGVVTVPELDAAADVQVDPFGRAVVGGRADLQTGSAMRVLRFVSGLGPN
jgi:hypothetical protein